MGTKKKPSSRQQKKNFKLFRKTFFDAEIEAHVYLLLFVVKSCLQVEATPGGLIDFWTCVLPFFHLLQVMILKIFFCLDAAWLNGSLSALLSTKTK